MQLAGWEKTPAELETAAVQMNGEAPVANALEAQ